MSHPHQCPRCELRFSSEADVKDHLVCDHGVDPESLEHRARLSAGVRPHRDVPDASRGHASP